MKKLALIAAMGLMSMGSAMAQSQTVTRNFNVTVNLLARCSLTAPANTTIAFGDYTAFAAGADLTSNSVAYTLDCTRGFGSPAVTFDDLGANGTTAGAGVVGGLRYTIASTVSASTPGSAATAAPAFIGSGDRRTVTLEGTMVRGQAGAATAATTLFTQPRILTITY